MKLHLVKGFDSSSGGFPSPIIDGEPISLPIPYPSSNVSYQHLNLGKIVKDLTGRKLTDKDLCHNDPIGNGRIWASLSAQSHLQPEYALVTFFVFCCSEKQKLWTAIIVTKVIHRPS